MDNRCIACGCVIPEGRQICKQCEEGHGVVTDNEIIKALRCCIHPDGARCSECSYDGDCRGGGNRMLKDALELINRQKAKIEALKEKRIEDDKLLNDRVAEAVNAVDKANQKYVDAHEKRIEDYKHLDVILNTAIDKLTEKIKAEAIKEFAERLKKEAFTTENGFEANEDRVVKLVTVKCVDNLVKEMTEEKENA